ncbi:MAG: arsenite methyltransferase [Nitrososphaerota archaeon]|nr:arsenite methyltransferase [Nitrososphaerota archaeon]
MSKAEKIKREVKLAYGSLAKNRTIPLGQGCCEPATREKLLRYGYAEDELDSLPESVVAMSDGCGNPTGLGMIRDGETVLDLGSGGGIDVFLASKRVGKSGRVIGLDMTPAMVQKARDSARKANLANAEFRLGEIESMPLDDGSVDVIISNCVICLSPDKGKVFSEMFRVLKRGGRLAIADEVANRPFTKEEKEDPAKWCSCVTGAITEKEYASALKDAGFGDVYVKQLRRPGELNPAVFSAFVSAAKQ